MGSPPLPPPPTVVYSDTPCIEGGGGGPIGGGGVVNQCPPFVNTHRPELEELAPGVLSSYQLFLTLVFSSWEIL